jgi:hypothetical protein
LLGVRPGSTATSISPSTSPRWRSITCCRLSADMVTGWKRTGDQLALHSLRTAHARSMFTQSLRRPGHRLASQCRRSAAVPLSRGRLRPGIDRPTSGGLPICGTATAISPWLHSARTRQSRHRPARNPQRTCRCHLTRCSSRTGELLIAGRLTGFGRVRLIRTISCSSCVIPRPGGTALFPKLLSFSQSRSSSGACCSGCPRSAHRSPQSLSVGRRCRCRR